MVFFGFFWVGFLMPTLPETPPVEAEAVPMSEQEVPIGGAKVVPPPSEYGKWACPINECREAAAHPLDECKECGGLSVTKRRRALKERVSASVAS